MCWRGLDWITRDNIQGSRVVLYYDQKPISDDAIAIFSSVPLNREK